MDVTKVHKKVDFLCPVYKEVLVVAFFTDKRGLGVVVKIFFGKVIFGGGLPRL